VGSSAFLRLVRISLVNGHAAVAGAVFVGALGAKFTMEHARILACESIYAGGAILADPGAAAAAQAASAGSASVDVVLANVDILDTVSSYGGGVLFANGARVEMRCGSVVGCNATSNNGGAFAGYLGYYARTELMLADVEITGCHATRQGGAMLIEGKVSLSMSGCLVEACTAVQWGGAIVAYRDNRVTISRSLFRQCSVTSATPGSAVPST
jgi:hypothetical protein